MIVRAHAAFVFDAQSIVREKTVHIVADFPGEALSEKRQGLKPLGRYGVAAPVRGAACQNEAGLAEFRECLPQGEVTCVFARQKKFGDAVLRERGVHLLQEIEYHEFI